MNSVGPIYISPYTGAGLIANSSQQIPIIIGRGGFIEVINTMNFGLYISLQSMGNAYQEARSKVLYTPQQYVQGTQTLIVRTPNNNDTANSTRFIRLPVAYQNGELGFFGIWINVYEQGEIEWYAPVSLANPPSESSYFATKTFSPSGSLVLPMTSDFFNNVPASLGTCDLLGFEFSGSTASANAGNSLVISNLNNQPDGSDTLSYVCSVGTSLPLTTWQVTFVTPIPNKLGNPITFTWGGASDEEARLNVYYSLT